MNPTPAKGTNGVLMPVEIICIALVFVLTVVLLAMTTRIGCRTRSPRINCISNLKQIGLAFRMWAGDHGDKFPWQVETNGTMDFAESPAVYKHFLAISNELSSPKVLACNTDKKITKEADWSKFNNAHLSYFVGLEANEANPQSILSGDRNPATNGKPATGLLRVTADTALGFTGEMHKHAGNIGLGDGSAQQVTEHGLRKQVRSALQSTNVAALRFSIPKPK